MGVAFTEGHVEILTDHLTKQVYQAMLKEDSPLYQSSMVCQLEGRTSDSTTPDAGGPSGQGGPEAVPGKRPAPKRAAPKRNARARGGDGAAGQGDDAELELALAGLDGGGAAAEGDASAGGPAEGNADVVQDTQGDDYW